MNCFAFVFRRNVNLNQTHYSPGNMQAGNIKKVPMYDNKGYGKLVYYYQGLLFTFELQHDKSIRLELCDQRRLRSAWASTDAQADLSLRGHTGHFVGFVVLLLYSVAHKFCPPNRRGAGTYCFRCGSCRSRSLLSALLSPEPMGRF